MENRGPFILCTGGAWPWGIARQIGDDWLGVKDITMTLEDTGVRIGETLRFGWVAENQPGWEEAGFAEVLPGAYRFSFYGWLCEGFGGRGERVDLFAYFEIVE